MATDESRKRTKYVPTIKVYADDFEVQDGDGTPYYPHAGEYVEFRQSVRLSVLRQLAGIQAMQAGLREGQEAMSEVDDDTLSEAGVGIITELINIVFQQVVDWTLTSDEIDKERTTDPDEPVYKRYPSPKHHRSEAYEAMWDFDNAFLGWMQRHMMDGAKVPNT